MNNKEASVGKICENRAIYRYTWPGRDEALCCWEHALQIKAVADAMGLHQQMIMLSEEDMILGLKCSSHCSK